MIEIISKPIFKNQNNIYRNNNHQHLSKKRHSAWCSTFIFVRTHHVLEEKLNTQFNTTTTTKLVERRKKPRVTAVIISKTLLLLLIRTYTIIITYISMICIQKWRFIADLRWNDIIRACAGDIYNKIIRRTIAGNIHIHIYYQEENKHKQTDLLRAEEKKRRFME